MTGAGPERGPCRLAARPSLLPSDERDRDPMVGNDRMKSADSDDGADEKQFGCGIHASRRYFR